MRLRRWRRDLGIGAEAGLVWRGRVRRNRNSSGAAGRVKQLGPARQVRQV